MKLSESPAWADLLNNHATLREVHLRDLFANDPARLDRLTAEAEGIYLDISKHRITPETLDLLIALAEQEGVARKLQAMMSGARVNTTEDRPALHTALRAPRGSVIEVDGENVVPQIQAVLDAMTEFSEALRSGRHTGATGKQIRNVIHIGIGGSHLGPRFVTDALRPFVSPALTMRFISNVDGADLHAAVAGLDPAETLFIVASKTFTTTETMSNAQAARSWVTASLGE
ncbi:MAG: glucose-6-phosphate isomerase, partial [Actinobacteria bacterium]|nr:glucose-6-phosphate isomerase [Actinomycetota bacterium]